MLQRVAAGALGAFLGVGLTYLSDSTMTPEEIAARRGDVVLDPAPEKFDVDPQTYTLFSHLSAFKGCSDKARDAYAEALQSLDSLLRMEEYLRTNKPSFGDRSLAETLAERFNRGLSRFLEQARRKASARDEIFLEDTVLKLQELGAHHLGNVYTLTSYRAGAEMP